MIVPDLNLLLYAMNSDSPHHLRAWEWWESAQRGPERIGLSWSVALGYVRLMTNPRVMPRPLSVAEAMSDVRRWWDSAFVDVLTPGLEHLHVMERLLDSAGRGGELCSDAHLAALWFENVGRVFSADADFARFAGVRWVNPLTEWSVGG
jgi:hypothetical protein